MNHSSVVRIVGGGFSPLLAAAIMSVAATAGADDAATVDTSRWVCKFCPFEEGLSAAAQLGPGYVSDKSAKFGEYTGLNQAGVYIVGSGEARYRQGDGHWLDVSLRDLGLDSRYAQIDGGKQGRYQLSLIYQETPHFIADTAVSPFVGIGSGALSLPAGWVPAATTGGMSLLATSAHGIDLETRRRALELNATLTPAVHWQLAADVRHEQKSGTLGTAGSFVFNAAQLGMPVDYDTDQIDVSAAYNSPRFQARLAYYGSVFKNDEQALTWATPYVPLVPGGTTGQLALAPSNKFQQLVASAGGEFSPRAHASADIAVGRMTQDEAFLTYTLNNNLGAAPLPRGSLDGTVDTVSGNLRLSSVVTNTLQLNASYAYDDRNNRTPQAVYDWITADTFPALPRANLPYSVTHSVAKVDGRWALRRDLRLVGGCDYDVYDRDLQEVRHTHESDCWGQATAHVGDRAEITWKGSHARRTISNYTPNPEIMSPENPLLRKYNLANRVRDTAMLRVDLEPGPRLALGLEANLARDQYTRSVLGLLDGRFGAVAADAAFALSEHTRANAHLNHERIRSKQANAELISGSPAWVAYNYDSVDTVGAGVEHHASDKLDVEASYTVVRSRGETSVAGAALGFPDLSSRLDRARLQATYRLNKRLSLKLDYQYENYRTKDWTLDGVTANTIPNLVGLAPGTPLYHVNLVALSARYSL